MHTLILELRDVSDHDSLDIGYDDGHVQEVNHRFQDSQISKYK